MTRACLVVSVALVLAAASWRVPAYAQASGPSDAAKAMVGAWELSNADRDKTCSVAFKVEPSGANFALSLDRKCAAIFPAVAAVASWTIGKNDALLLVDGEGKTVLELLEVETGMYEGLRPNEERYFLLNAAVAASTRDVTPDQFFGEWGFVRGNAAGRVICVVTFENAAASADSFALKLKSGCDQFVSRFAPASWKIDRGQLVLLSAKGEAWRFEAAEETAWRRVPENRQPLQLVKQ